MSHSTSDEDDLPVANWQKETAAPEDRPFELFDARDLPPPKPLSGTLERLADGDDATVLVQLNDRAPKLLYPKLDERGYEHDTKTVEEGVVTVVWK